MMKHPVYLQEKITQGCLLFDGMGRCGKTLVAPLVSDLPKVEYAQNIIAVNEIPTLWRLGSIEESAAVSLLRMVVDSLYERNTIVDLVRHTADCFKYLGDESQ